MKKNIAQKSIILRKLSLRSETVKQLTVERLADVVGGAPRGPLSNEYSCVYTTCPSEDC